MAGVPGGLLCAPAKCVCFGGKEIWACKETVPGVKPEAKATKLKGL